MTLTEAIALADAVARDGLEPHRAQIPAVIRLARDHGVRDPLVDALDDPEGPTVARIRALGRIVVLLASSNRSPSRAAMHPFRARQSAQVFQRERLAHPPLRPDRVTGAGACRAACCTG